MMNNVDFETLNADHAGRVLAASKAMGVCLLVVSKNYGQGKASFIYQHGIPSGMGRDYTHGIFRCCPYIRRAADTLKGDETFVDNLSFYRHSIASKQDDLNRYWHFLRSSGINETAACVRSVSENMLLLVGLLSANSSRSLSLMKTLSLADAWLMDSHKQLFEHCISNVYFDSDTSASSQPAPPLPQMSRRELQVVSHLCAGASNKEIASRLALSIYTVENYLRRIYQKFGVHNRTSLMAKLLTAPASRRLS